MKIFDQEILNDSYYHLRADIERYPLAWLFVIWSRRGPGKTYSGLRYGIAEKMKIIYMKRTNEDVKLICSGERIEDEFDPSPYAPLNRDFEDINIKPRLLDKGIGAFYNCDYEGEPIGAPVSYCLSLNAVKRFKGFDLSDCDMIIFDEFIPQQGEIVKKSEGSMLLDFYMTVARDRQKRGKPPLKLILFANAEEISTPITNTIEIVDDMAFLQFLDERYKYIEDRGILLHHITEDEVPLKEEEKQGIWQAMAHTSWGKKAFGGEFANNDFSNIGKRSLKHYTGYMTIQYKTYEYYMYHNANTGCFYMCSAPINKNGLLEFNLNRENDQKRFFMTFYLMFRIACAENRMQFEKYSMYDLIINFKKHFKML